MKKFYVALLATSLLLSGSLFAQVVETNTKFKGNQQPAYTIELPYSPDVAKQALKEYFNGATSSKGSEKRGVISYSGVNVPAISGDKLDMYATVNRKSRKEKNTSIVNVYVARGYDNFISSGNDAVTASGVTRFLEAFVPSAEKYNHTVSMDQQQLVISREEKKVKELESRVEKQEKELEKSRNELMEQRRKLDTERATLREMQGS